MMREYGIVRVVRSIQKDREYGGTESVTRAPRIGDVATVCHEYAPGDPTANLAVEMVDSEGYTIWLADFSREELELVEAPAAIDDGSDVEAAETKPAEPDAAPNARPPSARN